MKIKNIIYAGAALAAVAWTTSCQNHFDDPGLVVPVAGMEANTTIAEFKAAFEDDPNMQCPYKDEATKTPYIIKGRVISSDATGNIYQTLYIQDETSAMTFAIRRAGLYDYYHLGQEVVVNLTDLWVGKYNYLMQIGWLGESSLGVPQMSRVDFNVFQTHIELNGLPRTEVKYVTPDEQKPADSMYCIVENIDRLPTSPGEDFYNLQGQLVEFRNVSFEGGGELTYAPYQESVSRYITQEGNSLKLCVRNSGYATFYSETMPAGVGTVRGILSYYASDPTYTSTNGDINGWQLLIRSLDDVEFGDEGTLDKPYTIEKAREMVGQGRNAWVTGYIVGSVNGGVSTVTSASDITFGSDVELTNNIVIAPTADCTDWTQCMSVNLPQGSSLRQYGNLQDNPGVYKKQIEVRGLIDMFLGMPGVSGTGAADSFRIEGVTVGPDKPDTPDTPSVSGSGTQADPYSVAAVSASSGSTDDVWVVGYVVGYVADMVWSDSAVFGDQPTEGSTNYTNATNLILSDQPAGSASLSNSIPVGLASGVRNVLGISKNPAIYGKKVKLKGQMTRYFGQQGLKTVNEYEILD